MKLKFSLRFPGGEIYYCKKDHYEKFTADHIFRCLLDFTEVKDYACVFNDKERRWDVKITLPPMSATNFENKFKEALGKFYNKDASIHILEINVQRNETGKFTTSLVMKKIEG